MHLYTLCTELPQHFLLYDEMAYHGTPCSGSSAQAQAAAAHLNEVQFRFEAAGWRGLAGRDWCQLSSEIFLFP